MPGLTLTAWHCDSRRAVGRRIRGRGFGEICIAGGTNEIGGCREPGMGCRCALLARESLYHTFGSFVNQCAGLACVGKKWRNWLGGWGRYSLDYLVRLTVERLQRNGK